MKDKKINFLTLDDIKVPARIKPRGRPKGIGKTVIGFKRKVPKNESKKQKQIRLETLVNKKKSESVIKLN